MDQSNNRYLTGREDITFSLLCGSMLALLLLRDVGSVGLSKYIFLSLAVVVFIFHDINYNAIFMCFLIPLTVGIPNSYIFSVGLVIFVFKNIHHLAIKNYILVLMMIFAVELLSFIYGDFSLGDYLRFVAPLLFISMLIFYKETNLDYGKMLFYFVLASIGAQISIILQTVRVGGLESLISKGIRLGNTVDLLSMEGIRISFNPNGLSLLCIITIGILLVWFSNNIGNKTIIIALLAFEIFVGSMSLSRTYLILLIIVALISWISLAKSVTGFFKGFVILAVITFGVYTIINNYVPSVFESYSERLAVNDVTNGRLDIAATYFNVLAGHPERIFLGVGLQDYHVKYGVASVCHNAIQEILVTWGVIGLVLVSLYIFFIYKHGWREIRNRDRRIICLMPFILLLVSVQAGQFFSSSVTSMYLLPVYAAMRLASSNDHVDLPFVKDRLNGACYE